MESIEFLRFYSIRKLLGGSTKFRMLYNFLKYQWGTFVEVNSFSTPVTQNDGTLIPQEIFSAFNFVALTFNITLNYRSPVRCIPMRSLSQLVPIPTAKHFINQRPCVGRKYHTSARLTAPKSHRTLRLSALHLIAQGRNVQFYLHYVPIYPTSWGFQKHTKLAVMTILASEALIWEHKNSSNKMVPQWALNLGPQPFWIWCSILWAIEVHATWDINCNLFFSAPLESLT